MKNYYLGIDIGSISTKGVIIDDDNVLWMIAPDVSLKPLPMLSIVLSPILIFCVNILRLWSIRPLGPPAVAAVLNISKDVTYRLFVISFVCFIFSYNWGKPILPSESVIESLRVNCSLLADQEALGLQLLDDEGRGYFLDSYSGSEDFQTSTYRNEKYEFYFYRIN